MSFSKLLLLLESGIVLYTTYQGFGIAKLAIEGKGGKYGGRRDV